MVMQPAGALCRLAGSRDGPELFDEGGCGSGSSGRKVIRMRPTRRLVAVVALLIAALGGCTSRSDAGHGGSPSALSSGGDMGDPLAPSTSPTAGGSTVTTSRTVNPPTASPAPDGTATTASAPGSLPTAIGSTTWLLVRAVVAGAKYDSPQPSGSSEYSSYTVQFVSGQLVANDGCNTLEIAATVDARTVTTFGGMTSTAAACRDDSPLREAYDRELVNMSLGWKVAGAHLTLTTHGGDTFDYEPCRRRVGKVGADEYACLGPSR